MAANAAFQPAQPGAEPSMEEILASIRKIIADDTLGTKKDEPPPARAAPAPVALDDTDSDVLDLAQVATVADPGDDVLIGTGEDEAVSPMGAMPNLPEPVLVDFSAEQPVPAPARPAPVAPAVSESPLLGNAARGAVASAFASLPRHAPLPAPGRSIEDLVAELLRPMLRDWMDNHLPGLVERLVKAEIERVSRG